MEHLFSISIVVNDRNVSYDVIFDKEKYIFNSENGNKSFQSFSFKREHDEWLGQNLLPVEIKSQAVDALENYLMKQH